MGRTGQNGRLKACARQKALAVYYLNLFIKDLSIQLFRE